MRRGGDALEAQAFEDSCQVDDDNALALGLLKGKKKKVGNSLRCSVG